MRVNLACEFLVFSLLLVSSSITAVEFEGVVAAVDGKTLRVTTSSDLLPLAGDKVEIFVRIPGLDEAATIGVGEVTLVKDESIVVTIDRVMGKIAKGHLAKITSDNPVRRKGSEPPPRDEGSLPTPPDKLPASRTGENSRSRQIVSAVAQMLPKHHLSGHPLDDAIAERTLHNFLRALDPMKTYLTKDDVERAHAAVAEIDNDLRRGNITVFYDLMNRYPERLSERVAHVRELVGVDHDFTIDEEIITDGERRNYAKDERESNEIWRKRIKYDLLTEMAGGSDLAAARSKVRNRYESFQEQRHRITDDELLETVLTALASAYDPHSTYISQRTYQDFVIAQRKELVGIGAQLKLIDGNVEVTKVIPGGPADHDGRLKAGDRIAAVGQGDSGEMAATVGLRLADAVKLIRGESGTAVHLRVVPKGQFEAKVYKITRAKLRFSGIQSAVLPEELLPDARRGKVGYIKLVSFYGKFGSDDGEEIHSASSDMQKVLDQFKRDDVEVALLDLRNNGGGSLTEAINAAGLFLGDVPVLQVKGRDGRVQQYNATNAKITWDRPLLVLSNSITSGGSEILMAALQDYQRALIVGDEKSHGFGTVQSVDDIGRSLFRIDNPPKLGFLKVTKQRFYRAAGKSTQIAGVTPDVILPSITSKMKVREENLKYPMQADAIPAATFKQSDFVDAQLVKELEQFSKVRRSSSVFFKDLDRNIKRYVDQQQLGTISLNRPKFMKSRDFSDNEETDAAATIAGLDDVKITPYLLEAIAISLDYASRKAFSKAEAHYNEKEFETAIEHYKKAVLADPRFINGHYKLSWALSTCPERSVRDGRLAVGSATRACELDSFDKWYYIFALAIAQAEAGDFGKAKKYLKESLDNAPEDQRARYRYLLQRFENNQRYR